ncbi:biotin transport system substrate-specific component [Paenibacillus sp. DS2015]|uniref:biotin transporter BioY n=1 Tax=Paenibacillus sp. DS2015 TaxID=3373917 RepID=UPI003D1FB72F
MKTNNIRSLVFIALFAALFIVMSTISIRLGGGLVPFSLQTFAVVLSGLFLTPRNAFLSIFIVIVLSAFGLPLFSGQGGWATLTGYTAGFIFAFPFCALLLSLSVGRLLQSPSIKQNKVIAFIAFFIVFELFSSFFAYVPGIPWFMHVLSMSLPKALVASCYPFLLGDAIKSFVGAIVAVSLTPYIVHIRTSTVNKRMKETTITL